MSKQLNTESKGEVSPVQIGVPHSSGLKSKPMLSMSSRVFKLPSRPLRKTSSKQNTFSKAREHCVKLQEKETEASEFSTEESENETESPNLNVAASSYFGKVKTTPFAKAKRSQDQFDAPILPNLESELVGTNSDIHPKNRVNHQYRKQLRNGVENGSRRDHNLEVTVKKSRKNCNNRSDSDNFVESYKKKKKTELCKNWELFRKCKFGSDCAFAHGEQELVTKKNLPGNYKTRRCKQFHEEGYCAYGNRCQFLHLIIQKDVNKFSYSDLVKETIYQYESRSKLLASATLEDLIIKPKKTRRLRVFEEICTEGNQTMSNSDEQVDDSIWAHFASQLGEVAA